MMESYVSRTVDLDRRTGFNEYSEPRFATTVHLPARVQLTMKKIRTSEGDEVISDAQILLAPGTQISVGDQVTYQAQAYAVLGVRRYDGLTEEMLVVAFLGSIRGSA